MVSITLQGYIESVEDKGKFLQLCIRQKCHPTERYRISLSKEHKNTEHIKKGKVVECECGLAGRYPYNNIYINYFKVADNYKALMYDGVIESEGWKED